MKALLALILIFVTDSSFGKLKQHFVVEVLFKSDLMGVILKEKKSQNLSFFKVKDNFSVSVKLEEKDFLKEFNVDLNHYKKIVVVPKVIKSKEFKLRDGKYVSYEHLDCFTGYTDGMWRPTCKKFNLRVNGKLHEIKYYADNLKNKIDLDPDGYYFKGMQSLFDPVFFNKYIIFKGHFKAGESAHGTKFTESVRSLAIVDLEKNELVRNLSVDDNSPHFGPTISFIGKKNENSFWLANNFAIYEFNEKFEEKRVCYFLGDKEEELRIKCVDSDYVFDEKVNQIRLLEEKEKALKEGKEPPEDNTFLKFRYLKCSEDKKLSYELEKSFRESKDKNRINDPKYKDVIECYMLGNRVSRGWVDTARKDFENASK